MDDPIARLSRTIRVSSRRRHAIERELRSHLEDAQHDLLLAGLDPEAAAREGLARLGDPDRIANDFDQVYKPSRGTQLGAAFALAGALLLGMLSLSGPLANATSAHHAPIHHTVVNHRP